MGWRDINDRTAVRRAIEEFDALGRTAFLERYGFGKANAYFLVEGGDLYDSKAILGAAHGHQFGTPLRSGDFSGGEATVAPKLKELGFEVRKLVKIEA